MRRVRDQLIAHVGGHPNATQQLLIDRAVIQTLQLAQIDARIMAGEVFTDEQNRLALSWNICLRQTLADLGVAARVAGKPLLDPLEAIRQHTAARRGSGGRAA